MRRIPITLPPIAIGLTSIPQAIAFAQPPSGAEALDTVLSIAGQVQNLIAIIFTVGSILVTIILAGIGTILAVIYNFRSQHRNMLDRINTFESLLGKTRQMAVDVTTSVNRKVPPLVDLALPEQHSNMEEWIRGESRSMSIDEIDNLVQYHLALLMDLPPETFFALGHYHRYCGLQKLNTLRDLENSGEKANLIVNLVKSSLKKDTNDSFHAALRRYHQAAVLSEQARRPILESIAHQCRSICHYLLEQPEQSLSAIELALEKWSQGTYSDCLIYEPMQYLLHDTHGLVLAKEKKLDAAIEAFRKAATMSGDLRRPRFNLVCALTERGQQAEANGEPYTAYCEEALEKLESIISMDGVTRMALSDETLYYLREHVQYGEKFQSLVSAVR